VVSSYHNRRRHNIPKKVIIVLIFSAARTLVSTEILYGKETLRNIPRFVTLGTKKPKQKISHSVLKMVAEDSSEV
jgi:hypothetical protein